jgi:hypothetical protein
MDCFDGNGCVFSVVLECDKGVVRCRRCGAVGPHVDHDPPKPLTPAFARFLIHYHGCLEPIRSSIVHAEFLEWALADGIIYPYENTYQTTKLGSAWVRAICATPMPRVAYIGADGKEIK